MQVTVDAPLILITNGTETADLSAAFDIGLLATKSVLTFPAAGTSTIQLDDLNLSVSITFDVDDTGAITGALP